MSKRTRHADNSKRPQPLQQQRAQARQPKPGGSPSGGSKNGQQPRNERESGERR